MPAERPGVWKWREQLAQKTDTVGRPPAIYVIRTTTNRDARCGGHDATLRAGSAAVKDARIHE